MSLCAVSAQGSGGVVMDPSTPNAFDLFNISNTPFMFATARSAAMAGAFTSLGGDFSSVSVNPAGLGMYRHSEIVFTPMISMSSSSTNADSFESTSRTRFAPASLGFVINLKQGSGLLTSATIAFGYTRLADFNHTYSLHTPGAYNGFNTIASTFAGMLNATSATPKTFEDWGIDPSYWMPGLGYKTGMIGKTGEAWSPDMIGKNAMVDQYATIKSKGSVGEYSFAFGFNFTNKFYVGATLGVQTVTLNRSIYYGEQYSYDENPLQPYRMDYVNSDQEARLSGVGVDLKLGFIYRPFESLRIGLALHTPTYYMFNHKYWAGMTSRVQAVDGYHKYNPAGYTLDQYGYVQPPFSESTPTVEDSDADAWRASTPTRLMLGASYAFSGKAVVSVDYERAWYGGMRFGNTPYGRGLFNGYIKDNFRGSNTLRVGAEFKPISFLALRAGYGLFSGALKEQQVFSTPVVYKATYISAGIGISFSQHMCLDLAYQYSKNYMTDYATYYFENDRTGEDYASAIYSTDFVKHSILLSLTYKF